MSLALTCGDKTDWNYLLNSQNALRLVPACGDKLYVRLIGQISATDEERDMMKQHRTMEEALKSGIERRIADKAGRGECNADDDREQRPQRCACH